MRKQTRYMLLCAILAVLPFSAVHAADISLESVRAAGDEVTVKGKAAKNEEYVTMKVLKKDESSDILTVAQEKSGEDGSFEIEFSVPEEYDSAPTDVYYIITLHLNNSQAGDAEYEFKYVTPENREAFLDILKTKTPEEIIASMEENSEYKDGFKLEGALTDEFFALPEDSGLKLLSEILEGYNREDMTLYSFADDFNKIIYFTRVNSGEEIFDLLLKLDPSFEEEKFSALRQDRQELFAEIISRNIPYESYGGFLDGCTSAGAILKLNTARYSDIDGIMSEYKDELELAGDSSYNKYLDLSSSKKQSVCEKIVQSLDKDKIYTTEEFRELLKEAVDSLPTTGSSSGSGGSSGGSGGSGYMPGKNPAASNNQKTDVEENSPGGVTAVEADVKEPQQTAAFDDLDGVEWARDAI